MRNETETRTRGVFEKVPGSGEWWIRFVDADGRFRREKAGTKSAARTLYTTRKADALRNRKLPPKTLRTRVVPFSELADDYLDYATANNSGRDVDKYRIQMLKQAFGSQPAVIPIEELRNWFDEKKWKNATFNRCRTVLGLIYKLGIENRKVESNPARLLKHRREPKGRVRFLNQFEPDEENRLRKVIAEHYPEHMPEFEIALNTGLRRKEQYQRIGWECVDFLRADLFVPESKNGESRHIELTAEAAAGFQQLFSRTRGKGPIFAAERGKEKRVLGPRHWFDDAIRKAEIKDFSWHCLRHTFASRLAMSGADLLTIAELMGHKKIEMTKRYAHLAKSHKRSAMDRLSAFNTSERVRQKSEQPVILSTAASENPTDTITDTRAKSTSGTVEANLQ